MGDFSPWDSHPVVCFIIWKMHGFTHQFPIASEKTGKPIKWEKPGKLVPGKILQNPSYVENLGNWYSRFSHSMGKSWKHGKMQPNPSSLGEPEKLVPIFSPKYGYFSSIRSLSYGILYCTEKAWLFPSIYNSTEKCSKIYPVSSQVVFPQYYFPTCSEIWWFLKRTNRKNR